VKFRLKVDSDGVVQVVETIESSLSPSVTQKYKRAVQKLTFRPTSAGERPDISVGTITFRISSK
jgi:outer membrane biosynthesis protein TonB